MGKSLAFFPEFVKKELYLSQNKKWWVLMHLKMFVGIDSNGIYSKILKIHRVQPPKSPNVKTSFSTLQCTFKEKMQIWSKILKIWGKINLMMHDISNLRLIFVKKYSCQVSKFECWFFVSFKDDWKFRGYWPFKILKSGFWYSAVSKPSFYAKKFWSTKKLLSNFNLTQIKVFIEHSRR